MTRKNNLPPPPRGASASTSSGGGGTATTAPSSTYYSLSEIDDDSTAAAPPPLQQQGSGGDDNTEIDDNDSILEMAKRLDAASVISDPSFIEGPHNNNEQNYPSRGAYRMDDIVSESDESSSSSDDDDDDSSSSSSDSSTSSDGNNDNDEYHHRERYDYTKSRSRDSSRGGRYGSKNNTRNNNGRSRRREQQRTNPRQQQQQQQQQQQSSSMPSQPYYDNRYDGRGQQQQQQQQQHNMSYPGARERKYSPPRGAPIDQYRGGGGYQVDPRSAASNNNNSAAAYDKQQQAAVAAAYEKKQKQERYYDREDTTAEESSKRRRTKMILIPTVVILIIGIVVAVAVVVGKGTTGGGGGNGTSQENDNVNAFQPIPVPTASPTYVGLYQCPLGKSGPTVTKGCLGFVECSDKGIPLGPIQYCSQGTLYDVQTGVCAFAENVSCSTTLPTQEDYATVFVPPTTTTGGVVGVVPPAQPKPPSLTSTTVGPITTLDHKVLFEGVVNPGQLDNNALNRMAKNLEAYLNIFYSPRVVSAYSNGDYVLESIGNVTIELEPIKFEFVQSSNRRNNLRRDLQTFGIQANGFAMTYQQTTKYDTIDPAITVGAVVRLPYRNRYQDRIVSYLQAADPVFSTLTRALFVEGDIGGQPQSQPAPIVPVPNPSPPTRKPTTAPTKQSVVAMTNQDNSPSYRIQGLLFFDENGNGIFDYESEPPFDGVWATLRLCTKKADGNDWVSTAASEAQGLYKFDDVEENEYFIDFFKPSPGDDYNFTVPQVAGNDDSVLDSDVIGFIKHGHGGRTACFTVGPGFDSTKYINAGYKLKATPPPSPALTKSPTQSPIDVSYYCADVTTNSDGTQNYNFLGCQIRCGNGFNECPGDTRCVFADVCIEPV